MDGLPVLSCDGCGACCQEQGLPPRYTAPERLGFLSEELRSELALHLAEERRLGSTRNERGLPCLWYDAATKRCSRYELRPDCCREAQIGGESCVFWRRRRYGLGAPGAGGQAPTT